MNENDKDWSNPAFRNVYFALALADHTAKGNTVVNWLNRNGFCNLTCCPECHVDDFVHVEGCIMANRIARAASVTESTDSRLKRYRGLPRVLVQPKEIERCRAEQRRCRHEILNGILNGNPDQFGAWLGLSDWFQEELIMLIMHWETLADGARAQYIYRDINNMDFGGVKRCGGSWECVYDGDVVAYRGDLEMAKRVVEQLHEMRLNGDVR